MARDNELENSSTLSIKDMVRISGLSEHTLRYYEKIGIIEPIPRHSSSGHRRYSSETASLVETLSCLRASGLSLKDIRTYLRLRKLGDEGAAQQKALFEAHALKVAQEIERLKVRQEFLANKVAYWAARELGDTEESQRIATANQKLASKLK